MTRPDTAHGLRVGLSGARTHNAFIVMGGTAKGIDTDVTGRHTWMVVEDGSSPGHLPGVLFEVVGRGGGEGRRRTFESRAEGGEWPQRAVKVKVPCLCGGGSAAYIPRPWSTEFHKLN